MELFDSHAHLDDENLKKVEEKQNGDNKQREKRNTYG